MSKVFLDPIQSSESVLLKPKWVISRGKDRFVPLVAVDELPSWICLCGAPRNIPDYEAQGMQLCGMLAPTDKVYTLRLPGNDSQTDSFEQRIEVNLPDMIREQAKASVQKDALAARDASFPPLRAPSKPNQQAKSPQALSDNINGRMKPLTGRGSRSAEETKTVPTLKRYSISPADGVTSTTGNTVTLNRATTHVVTATRRPLPPSGIEPDQSKKVYCTYWIRTGECDYMQSGCYFKHEMPDIVTLRKIGFRKFPKWWSDKQQIKRLAIARNKPPEIAVTKHPKRFDQTKNDTTNLGAIGSEREQARQIVTRKVSNSLDSPNQKIAPTPPQRIQTVATLAKSNHAPSSSILDAKVPQQQPRQEPPGNLGSKAALLSNNDEDLLIWDTLTPELSPHSSTARESPQSNGPATPPASPAVHGAPFASAAPHKRVEVHRTIGEKDPIHRFATEPYTFSPERLALEETNRKMAEEARAVAKENGCGVRPGVQKFYVGRLQARDTENGHPFRRTVRGGRKRLARHGGGKQQQQQQQQQQRMTSIGVEERSG